MNESACWSLCRVGPLSLDSTLPSPAVSCSSCVVVSAVVAHTALSVIVNVRCSLLALLLLAEAAERSHATQPLARHCQCAVSRLVWLIFADSVAISCSLKAELEACELH